MPSGLPVIGQSFLIVNGGVPGVYVHVPIQSNSTYLHMFIRYIYETI